MKATRTLTQAAILVGTDRAKAYGDAKASCDRIAALWNGILIAAGKRPVQPIDAHDVATMMEGLKIARRYSGPFSADTYIDSAGYAAIAGQIRGGVK